MGQGPSTPTIGEIVQPGPYIPTPNPDPEPNVAMKTAWCTAGYYCTAGSSNQIICPPGYYCPERSATPIACVEKTYCPQGASSPQPCLAGHYCPAKSWAHLLCMEGYYCPINTGTQIRCGVGTYCPQGSTVEKTCPIGSYCPSGCGFPVRCTAGNYCPTTGLASQIPCPVGSYSGDGASACTVGMAPPNGTVDWQTGKLTCDSGYTELTWRCLQPWTFASTVDGVVTCPPCYSMNGTMCTLSMTCTPTCSDGYVLDPIAKACSSCPVGQYTDNGVCVPCGAGSTSALGERGCTCTGTSTISNSKFTWKAATNSCIIQCNAGYYRQTPTTCTLCPLNTYCPVGTVTPNNCPAGTVSPVGSSSCEIDFGPSDECPAGSWSDPTTKMCRLCPAGTYSSAVGATSASTCLTCQPGTTSAMGSRSCT